MQTTKPGKKPSVTFKKVTGKGTRSHPLSFSGFFESFSSLRVREFTEVLNEVHLNDLRAGCLGENEYSVAVGLGKKISFQRKKQSTLFCYFVLADRCH